MAIRIEYSPAGAVAQLAAAIGTGQGQQIAHQQDMAQLQVHNQMVQAARQDAARREATAIEAALRGESLENQRQQQASQQAQQQQRLQMEQQRLAQQQQTQAAKQEAASQQAAAIEQLPPEIQKLVKAGVRPPADVISPDQPQAPRGMTAGQQQEATEFALREVERLRKDAQRVSEDILAPEESRAQAEQILNTPYEQLVKAQIDRVRMAQEAMFPPPPAVKPATTPVQQTPQAAGTPQAQATQQVLSSPQVQQAFEQVVQAQFQQMFPQEAQSPQAFARFRQDVLANMGSRGPLNPATASILLSQAGGDKDTARALALFSGFTIPQ